MTKPLRILFVSNAKAVGGGEVYLRNIIEYFGDDSKLFVLCRKEIRYFLSSNIKKLPYWPDTPARVGQMQRFAQRWQRLTLELAIFIARPDIVSVQSFSSDIKKLQKICRRLKIPIVYTAHTLFDPSLRDIYKGNLPVLNDFDGILCVCNKTKENLRTLGVTKPKLLVVYNGVDTTKFTLSSDKKTKVIWVGRVDEADKNPRMFLEIARLSQNKNVPYEFTIVGDGPLLKTLEKESAEKEINNLFFTGFIKNSSEIYKDAFALCLTSTSEAMPLSVLESMASGVPVIATAVGGVPEIITSPKEGTLIKTFSSKDFVAAIEKLSVDTDEWKKQSKASRGRILESFQARKQYNKIKEVYEELI